MTDPTGTVPRLIEPLPPQRYVFTPTGHIEYVRAADYDRLAAYVEAEPDGLRLATALYAAGFKDVDGEDVDRIVAEYRKLAPR